MSRYLDCNEGTEVPEVIIFYHVVTTRLPITKSGKRFKDIFKLGLALAVIMRGNKVVSETEYVFKSKVHFWNFIYSSIKSKKSNWVYGYNCSHNLQILDIYSKLVSRELVIHEEAGDFQIGKPLAEKTRPWHGLFVVDNLPFFIRCRSKSGTLVFCDIMNYFKMSMVELSEALRLPLPAEISNKSTEEQQLTSAKDTVNILKSLMIPLMMDWKSGHKGNWNYTAAGLAWNNYRHIHAPVTNTKSGKRKVNIVIHDNLDCKQLERQAYNGGQIIAFFYGYVSPIKDQFDIRAHSTDLLHSLDIRSLYPFCMAQAKYPYSLRKYIEQGSLKLLNHWGKAAGVIAEVKLNSPTIPWLIKVNNQQQYATGEIHTTLCGDELVRAMDENIIVSVGRMAVYNIADIFSDYVKYWYKERIKAGLGDLPHSELLAKLMLNSLYGKFGQKSAKWVDRPEIDLGADFGRFIERSLDGENNHQYRVFCGNTQEKMAQTDHKLSFCAISAFITANGREYMRKLREQLPKNSVYYQNTDSLIVNHKAYEILKKNGEIGARMGQLRETEEVTSSAEFFGLNDYVFGRKEVRGGRKDSAVKLDNYGYEQEEYSSMAEVITGGNQNGANGRIIQVNRSPGRYTIHNTDNGFISPIGAVSLTPDLLKLHSLLRQQQLFSQ